MVRPAQGLLRKGRKRPSFASGEGRGQVDGIRATGERSEGCRFSRGSDGEVRKFSRVVRLAEGDGSCGEGSPTPRDRFQPRISLPMGRSCGEPRIPFRRTWLKVSAGDSRAAYRAQSTIALGSNAEVQTQLELCRRLLLIEPGLQSVSFSALPKRSDAFFRFVEISFRAAVCYSLALLAACCELTVGRCSTSCVCEHELLTWALGLSPRA